MKQIFLMAAVLMMSYSAAAQPGNGQKAYPGSPGRTFLCGKSIIFAR